MTHKRELLKTTITIFIANIMFGIAIACFIKPHGIIVGGATGITLTLEHYFHLNFSITLTVINIFLFVIGFIFLGKKFALTTILSTFLYPFFVSLFLSFEFLSKLTDDVLLSAILGALILGVALGLILRMGASSGGMDIPPLILNKKFNIPLAFSLYAFDTCILISQAGFSDKEQILYGILFTIMCSFIVNKVIVMGAERSQIFIISKEYQKIKEMLLREMNLGVTMINIETAMTESSQQAVLCITTSRMVYKVNSAILKIDPYAFITISSINEVKGVGFSIARDNKLER